MENEFATSSFSAPVGESIPIDKSILLVDDDKPFCDRLARAMASRGFEARMTNCVADGLAAIDDRAPARSEM